MNIVRSYFKILWRTKFTIGIYFAVFLIISLISMAGFSNSNRPDQNLSYQNKYLIGIVNRNAEDSASQGLIEYLQKTYRTTDVPDDPQAMQDAVASGVADYVLLIRDDGSLRYYGRTEDGSAVGINMHINEYMENVGIWRDLTGSTDFSKVEEIMNKEVPIKIIGNQGTEDAITFRLRNYFQYATYPMLMMMMYGVFMGYKNFNKELIVQRLNITKYPRNRIMLQLIGSSVAFVGIVWLLFAVTGTIMFRQALFTPVGLAMLFAILVFLIPVTALGYLVNAFATRDAAATAASNAIALGLSFISGAFLPQWLLSDGLLRVASLFPPYWLIRSLDAIVAHQGQFSPELWQTYGIQLLIACAFIAVILLFGRVRPAKMVESEVK